MSILVLNDVVLSNRVISAGVQGRQIRKNQRVTTASGFESINIVWDKTLREYDIGTVPLLREDWQYLESLFEVTDGGAYGFLMLDPKDQRAAAGEGLTAASATVDGGFQLYKRYTERASGRYRDRKISRPRLADLQVYVSDVPVTSPTVDEETGIITGLSGDPDPSDVTWTGSFYVPVHFLVDMIDWRLVASHQNVEARYIVGPTVTLQEVRE